MLKRAILFRDTGNGNLERIFNAKHHVNDQRIGYAMVAPPFTLAVGLFNYAGKPELLVNALRCSLCDSLRIRGQSRWLPVVLGVLIK